MMLHPQRDAGPTSIYPLPSTHFPAPLKLPSLGSLVSSCLYVFWRVAAPSSMMLHPLPLIYFPAPLKLPSLGSLVSSCLYVFWRVAAPSSMMLHPLPLIHCLLLYIWRLGRQHCAAPTFIYLLPAPLKLSPLGKPFSVHLASPREERWSVGPERGFSNLIESPEGEKF